MGTSEETRQPAGPRRDQGAVGSNEEAVELGLPVIPYLAHLLLPLDLRGDKDRRMGVGVRGRGRGPAASPGAGTTGRRRSKLHRVGGTLPLHDAGLRLLGSRARGSALGVRHLLFIRLALCPARWCFGQHTLPGPLSQVFRGLERIQEGLQFRHHLILFLFALLGSLVSKQYKFNDRPFSAC